MTLETSYLETGKQSSKERCELEINSFLDVNKEGWALTSDSLSEKSLDLGLNQSSKGGVTLRKLREKLG